MKPRVYIETTIPSYLQAWPSRDLVRAAHQQLTREWWDRRRGDFELFISELVRQECAAGDAAAAKERLQAIANLPILGVSAPAATLANTLLAEVPLPKKAALDALHIAIAVLNGMDYLLTWNCTHIANATLRSRIEAICRKLGHMPPIICTPEELLEEKNDGS